MLLWKHNLNTPLINKIHTEVTSQQFLQIVIIEINNILIYCMLYCFKPVWIRIYSQCIVID